MYRPYDEALDGPWPEENSRHCHKPRAVDPDHVLGKMYGYMDGDTFIEGVVLVPSASAQAESDVVNTQVQAEESAAQTKLARARNLMLIGQAMTDSELKELVLLIAERTVGTE